MPDALDMRELSALPVYTHLAGCDHVCPLWALSTWRVVWSQPLLCCMASLGAFQTPGRVEGGLLGRHLGGTRVLTTLLCS